MPLADEQGSIPAYAGDPKLRHTPTIAAMVYPRLRGGSREFLRTRAGWRGLSPPTRGIPCLASHCRAALGSIPAYAGDPHAKGLRGILVSVYPRLRGGSSFRLRWGVCLSGLSPPTRGIHIRNRIICVM